MTKDLGRTGQINLLFFGRREKITPLVKWEEEWGVKSQNIIQRRLKTERKAFLVSGACNRTGEMIFYGSA